VGVCTFWPACLSVCPYITHNNTYTDDNRKHLLKKYNLQSRLGCRHLHNKLVCNVCDVRVQRQTALRSSTRFHILPRLCQGEGKKTFSGFRCLQGQHAACERRVVQHSTPNTSHRPQLTVCSHVSSVTIVTKL